MKCEWCGVNYGKFVRIKYFFPNDWDETIFEDCICANCHRSAQPYIFSMVKLDVKDFEGTEHEERNKNVSPVCYHPFRGFSDGSIEER